MMHVCHFSETTLEGEYFRHIAEGLVGAGMRVTMVELGRHNPPTWLSALPSVRYFALDSASRLTHLAAAFRLAGMIKKEEIDILHTHLFHGGLVGVFTKLFQSRAIVAMMRHHTGVVKMLGTPLHVKVDRFMARRADRCLTVSDAAREYMIREDGIEREIEVAYLGFDFRRFAPDQGLRSGVRRELGFSENDFVIGYVANFAPGKGHLQLVRAFAEAAKSIPYAKLLLVGKGGLPEIDAEIERLMISDKVVFGGWRTDVHACLNAMDMFVQPSLSEAFSQVLIEAMGVGLPVIATDVGAAREVVHDGQTGLLVAPDDEQAMASAMASLASDRSRAMRLAAAGREEVTSRFTVEAMVERHVALYRSWLQS